VVEEPGKIWGLARLLHLTGDVQVLVLGHACRSEIGVHVAEADGDALLSDQISDVQLKDIQRRSINAFFHYQYCTHSAYSLDQHGSSESDTLADLLDELIVQGYLAVPGVDVLAQQVLKELVKGKLGLCLYRSSSNLSQGLVDFSGDLEASPGLVGVLV